MFSRYHDTTLVVVERLGPGIRNWSAPACLFLPNAELVCSRFKRSGIQIQALAGGYQAPGLSRAKSNESWRWCRKDGRCTVVLVRRGGLPPPCRASSCDHAGIHAAHPVRRPAGCPTAPALRPTGADWSGSAGQCSESVASSGCPWRAALPAGYRRQSRCPPPAGTPQCFSGTTRPPLSLRMNSG